MRDRRTWAALYEHDPENLMKHVLEVFVKALFSDEKLTKWEQRFLKVSTQFILEKRCTPTRRIRK